MADKIVWTHEDMIQVAVEWWERDDMTAADCEVVQALDGNDNPCLVVLHKPTGRTSAEAGDGGRCRLDGTSYLDGD